MFLEYTEKFLSSGLTGAKLYSREDKTIVFVIQLDYIHGKLLFFETKDGKNSLGNSDFNVLKKEISSTSNEYFDYLSLFLQLYSLR